MGADKARAAGWGTLRLASAALRSPLGLFARLSLRAAALAHRRSPSPERPWLHPIVHRLPPPKNPGLGRLARTGERSLSAIEDHCHFRIQRRGMACHACQRLAAH